MQRALIAVAAAYLLFVMAATFTYNMHRGGDWCAHPERSGNWIVAPFCKTAA